MIPYLSICSGIEAWSVACEGLGFTAAGFSEIEAFPSAVLAQRFGSNLPGDPLSGNAPPNFGDFTRLIEDGALRARLPRPLGLLVGGTPCQAFSFAGKRLSLADARGNLTLAFAVLAHELARSHGLRNALWENVPGVLSAPDNAFGCFLGALVGADAPLDLPAGLGRWPDAGMVAGPRARAAWRVLDAQYFGLAQRRERVFVVVDLGGGGDPAAVLFEPQSLQGNSPPRREAGQKPAPTVTGGARSRGGYSHDDIPLVGEAYGGGNRSEAIDVAATLTAKGQRIDFEVETFIAEIASTLPAGANATGGARQPGMGAETAATYLVAHTLRGDGFDASEDGTGRGIPLVPVALRGHADYGAGLPCLRAEGGDAGGGSEVLIAFDTTQITSAANRSNPRDGDPCHPLAAAAHPPAVAYSIMPQNSGRDFKAREVEVAQPLMAGGLVGGNQGGDYVLQHWAVRRLTPTECARLQGFQDDHSRIPWRGRPVELCPDGPQYKAYGNSMAVKVMRWLAERLEREMTRAA